MFVVILNPSHKLCQLCPLTYYADAAKLYREEYLEDQKDIQFLNMVIEGVGAGESLGSILVSWGFCTGSLETKNLTNILVSVNVKLTTS